MNEERKVKYPAIYRHFKGLLYATIGVSKPKSIKELCDSFEDKYFQYSSNTGTNKWWSYGTHTETNKEIVLYYHKESNTWYHDKNNEPGELVLYKSLYDGTGIYCRPKEMFLSEVDREKYHDIKQRYRFEVEENVNEE